MRDLANRHRRDITFKINDLVWLSTKQAKPKQLEETPRSLQPLYTGPYMVMDVINRNAYRLQLPETFGRTHNVFNVSALKAYEGPALPEPNEPEKQYSPYTHEEIKAYPPDQQQQHQQQQEEEEEEETKEEIKSKILESRFRNTTHTLKHEFLLSHKNRAEWITKETAEEEFPRELQNYLVRRRRRPPGRVKV